MGKRARKDTGPPLIQVSSLAEAAEVRRQLAERERELLGETIESANADIRFANDLHKLAMETIRMARERLELFARAGGNGNGNGTARRESRKPPEPPKPQEPAEPAQAPRRTTGRRPSPMQEAISEVLAADGPLGSGEVAQRLIEAGHDVVDGDDAKALTTRVSNCLNNGPFKSLGRGVGYALA